MHTYVNSNSFYYSCMQNYSTPVAFWTLWQIEYLYNCRLLLNHTRGEQIAYYHNGSYRILVRSQAAGLGGRSITDTLGSDSAALFVAICFACVFTTHAPASDYYRMRSIASSHRLNTWLLLLAEYRSLVVEYRGLYCKYFDGHYWP